jgi:hypothetical protein
MFQVQQNEMHQNVYKVDLQTTIPNNVVRFEEKLIKAK